MTFAVRCIVSTVLKIAAVHCQGEKVVFFTKVRGKYRFSRKQSGKIYAFWLKVRDIFVEKSV